MSEVERFRGFADLVGLPLEDFQLEVMEAGSRTDARW